MRTVNYDLNPASPLGQSMFAKIGSDENVLHKEFDVIRRCIEWLVEEIVRSRVYQ